MIIEVYSVNVFPENTFVFVSLTLFNTVCTKEKKETEDGGHIDVLRLLVSQGGLTEIIGYFPVDTGPERCLQLQYFLFFLTFGQGLTSFNLYTVDLCGILDPTLGSGFL